MNNLDIVMTVTNPCTWSFDPRVMKEAKALVDSGYKVMVIGWDRKGDFPSDEIIDGINLKRVKVKSEYGNPIVVMLKLPQFYLKAIRIITKTKPKAVHTHDFDTAIVGFFSKYLLRKKWVYDTHDLYFTYFLKKKGISRILAQIVKKIDIFFAKRCDRLIVTTERINGKIKGAREYYTEAGIDNEKIITIWNVPDVDAFLNYTKLNLQKSEKYTIGYIGTQRTVENFIQLFKAVSLYPKEYKILFVGKGSVTDELKKIVREQFSNLDIEFIGLVDYDKIPNYYKLCDVVFIYYKYGENIKRAMSNKAFESCILGIPIIVNDNTLTADFVKKYKCGIAIKKLTPSDFIKALEKLKDIKFDTKVIREQWNWSNERRKLAKLYASLISNNKES